MVRPISGGTPRNWKALPDIRTARTLSGANSPVSSMFPGAVAMTLEKAGSSAIWRYSPSR
jgi:hypothetical protein